MIKISTNILGTFALKNSRIIEKVLFPKDAGEIAKKLLKISEGNFCKEEKELIERLKRSRNEELLVKKPERFSGYDFGIKFIASDKTGEDVVEIGLQLGISREEVLELTKKVNFELTKLKLKTRKRDKILIQAINTLDELDDIINLLMEHLREFSSLNFPELSSVVKNPEVYAQAIFDEEGIDPSLRKKIQEIKKESLGMEFKNEDEEAMKFLSQGVLSLYETKNKLENYIENLVRETCPNLNALLGPLLAARLISLAGGLKKLALMPSSTIQILGAEEAFFKFLKTGKRPPKHGIIFQLPEIRTASRKMRGKLSRTLAGKIAIAAKTDFYKGNFIGDTLRKYFLKRVDSLKKQMKI